MSANPLDTTPAKDIPLRDDIRLLGRLLGDTIREQEGESVFDIVERIRQTSIRFHREEDEGAQRELQTTLNSLSRGRTNQIIRAYSYFSHLSNLAEDQHHVRRSRAHMMAKSGPRPGTIANALRAAQAAGVKQADLAAFFASALVSPVLTAHPTEVRRKSTIDREMEVSQILAMRDRQRLTPAELSDSEEALRRAILTLWQTSILRRNRLKVIDEVMNGLSYYDYTFFEEIPGLYASLEDQLAAQDPIWNTVELPSFLRMGSWIGGDRDGNPFVTADALRQGLLLQSQRALSFYLDQVNLLGGELSLDGHYVAVSEQAQALADSSPDHSPHRQDEPYRRALSGIYARLAATAARLGHAEIARHAVGVAPTYENVEEFSGDLAIIHRSLLSNGSGALARGRLRKLRRAVDVFGFHLASIDMRQNSDVHERVVARTPRESPSGNGLCGPAGKGARVAAAGGTAYAAPAGFTFPRLFGRDRHRNLQSLAKPRMRTGSTARISVPNYVISKASDPSDILEVALLLKEAGLLRPRDGEMDVNIVPLFETIDDLRNSGTRDGRRCSHCRISCGFCAAAGRRRRSCSAIRTATRMAAFSPPGGSSTRPRSNSSRSSGVTPSDCGCFMDAAARSAAAAGPAIRRFSRSRAAPCRARSASPNRAKSSPASTPTAISGDATWRSSLRRPSRHRSSIRASRLPATNIWPPWRNCRRRAFEAYRGLVYETEGFERYFWESTVIGEIANLNIGSRPASRTNSRRIEDLRAIPWVFGWAQCRLMLPGWYGFGSAVDAFLDAHPDNGMPLLQEMYREWPFFEALISNMDMVLAKSNIAIASQYAKLVEDKALRDAIFPRIRREWESSIAKLLVISGQEKLLDGNPLLARSIRNRFPYLDPLNHLQIELLKRHRAGDRDERVVEGIHLSINGIAAGLRNSG